MNASSIKLANQLEKLAKKGRLTKLVQSNLKKSSKLVEILKGANDMINFSTAVHQNDCHNVSQQPMQPMLTDPLGGAKKPLSDAEYLKSYYATTVGGPKHSVAVNRAHHLTKYLSEFVINAYHSGVLERPTTRRHSDMVDYTFEISSVELLPDLTSLKVYWFTSGVDQVDAEIEHVLEIKTKAELRGLLANGRVLSYIPPVRFVRDPSKAMLNKINSCMESIKAERDKNPESFRAEASEQVEPSAPQPVKKEPPNVSNLYGVDFNRLIESIKKTSFSEFNRYDELKSAELVPESETPKDVVTLGAKKNLDEKFRRDMFSFQLNQKKKFERLSKSAIMKISLLEYEEFKQKS